MKLVETTLKVNCLLASRVELSIAKRQAPF